MQKTSIEWVKNPDGTQGYTLNPMTGCLNCIGGKCGGVFPCYAYLESIGRCHWLDLKGEPIEPGHDNESFYPRLHMKRFNQLWTAPTGAGIFLCDRSDWAASYWPGWCQRFILEYAKTRTDVRLYLLTKQPQNLINFTFPDNCWVGVTVTKPEMFGTAIYHLENVEAKIKYLSLEPLLKHFKYDEGRIEYYFKLAGINWVIIGALTGTKQDLLRLNSCRPSLTLMPYGKKWTLQPHVESVQEIVEACDKAGISVFLKDNLRPIFKDWSLPEWARFGRERNPNHPLHLRQEMSDV